MTILKHFWLVCLLFLTPLGLSAQSKPIVPPPKVTDPGPPPDLKPDWAPNTPTFSVILKNEPSPLSFEIERELRAFVVGFSICSQQKICGSVDFLWRIPPGNIIYISPSANDLRVIATPEDIKKWHSFLTAYNVPQAKDSAPLKNHFILLSASEEGGLGIGTDSFRGSNEPVILIVVGRGFYSHEAVPDPRIKTIRGRDFLSAWEKIAMSPSDISKLPSCNNLSKEDRDLCEDSQRETLELQYRLVNLASVGKRYELLTTGDEKLKMPGPQLAKVEHCTYDKLQATVKMEAAVASGSSHIEAAQGMMKDPEAQSCANLLWDYNFNATTALFDAGNKFHGPTGAPLLPEEMYNFYDGYRKKEKVVADYVRWRLGNLWYEKSPNVDLYKVIWDPEKSKRRK